jgi:hypothetical protein
MHCSAGGECQFGGRLRKSSTEARAIPSPPRQAAAAANGREKRVHDLNTKQAPTESAAAQGWLDSVIASQDFRTTIANLPMAKANVSVIVEMLQWEFKRLPILHNGPLLQGGGAIPDDSDLETTLSNGYLQNVCQRWLLGVEGKGN